MIKNIFGSLALIVLFASASFICPISWSQNQCLDLFQGEPSQNWLDQNYLKQFVKELHIINAFANFKIFNAKLEQILARTEAGVTVEDRKTIKVFKEIKRIHRSDIEGHKKISLTEIDAIAFKIRKMRLLVDQEFLAGLSFRERMLAEETHQAILVEGLRGYIESLGIGVVDRWSARHPFRTLWYSVVERLSIPYGVTFFTTYPVLFPKAKSPTLPLEKAIEMAWPGVDNSTVAPEFKYIYKSTLNYTTRAWHILFVSGLIALGGNFLVESYFKTQESKDIIVQRADVFKSEIQSSTTAVISNVANDRFLEWVVQYKSQNQDREPPQGLKDFVKSTIEKEEKTRVTVN